MATVVERLRLVIDADAKGVRGEIDGVSDSTEKASLKTRLMTSAQDRLGVSAETMGTALKGAAIAGAGVAAVGIAKWAADGVETVVNLTGQIRDFQRVTGASAEDSSRWVAALDDMEISAASGEKAAFKLATQIGAGKDKLAEFGVEVVRNKDGTLNLSETLLNVADAYTHTADQGDRNALVMSAFGKAGKDLIPILEQGRKGIKDLFEGAEEGHQIFSQEDLQSAREFELALDDMKDNLRGFQIEVGKAVLPQLTSTLDTTTGALQTADEAAGLFGSSLGDVFGSVERALNPVSALQHGIEGLFGGGGEEAQTFADKQKAVQEATQGVAEAITEHGRKSTEAKDAQRELTAASRDLQGAQKEIGGALQDVNTKLQDHTTKLYADQQATLVAAGDKIAFENAVAGVGKKFEDLNLQLFLNATAGNTSKEAADAQTQSQRDLSTAVLSVMGAAAKAAVDGLGPLATETEKAKAATDAQKTALANLEAKFPGLRGQIGGYIADLGGIPFEVLTYLTAIADQALRTLGDVNGALDRLNGKRATVFIDAAGSAKGVLW